jgi:hypothetical protein
MHSTDRKSVRQVNLLAPLDLRYEGDLRDRAESTSRPTEQSFAIVYTTGRARVPKFIELDAIDHIDWQLSNQQ